MPLVRLTHQGFTLADLNLDFMPQANDLIRYERTSNAVAEPRKSYFLRVVHTEHYILHDNHVTTFLKVEFEDNEGFIPEEWT